MTMKNYSALGVILLGLVPAVAQENQLDLDALVTSAEEWANENLDEDVLRALESVDRDKAHQFFADIQKGLHSDYVFDLAALKNTSKTVLPLLAKYEETAPYAFWLKTRLDYLDVADKLKSSAPAPKPSPGKPPAPPPNPSPEKERQAWVEQLSERPWPEAAKPYVARLKPVFAAQQVPPELVWIAEVESSFDPRARSPVGATGLFQLMPDTAKRYGLRTSPFDQRLKIEPSGEAAAKYLRFLHGHFKDWRLALAAYNSGEGTVQKLLKRHKAKTFDEIATHLPAETQMLSLIHI